MLAGLMALTIAALGPVIAKNLRTIFMKLTLVLAAAAGSQGSC